MYRVKISTEEMKRIRSLATKKGRRENGLFIVEGEKMVAEAQASGLDVKAIYRRDDIGDEAMARISCLDTPPPCLAVVAIPTPAEARPAEGLCLALDGVRDPGNLGTILRIADWFGIERIYASPDSVDQFNPKVIQSTMGAILRRQVCYCDIAELCRAFRAEGREVLGTFMSGENVYTKALPANPLLVMGSESHGISEAVERECPGRLTIPRFTPEGSESLNVAVATAIFVSEFKRNSFK